jgi:hypothetical protein
MKLMSMKPGGMTGPFAPRATTTAAIDATRALLGLGTMIGGLLGPGALIRGLLGDGNRLGAPFPLMCVETVTRQE